MAMIGHFLVFLISILFKIGNVELIVIHINFVNIYIKYINMSDMSLFPECSVTMLLLAMI